MPPRQRNAAASEDIQIQPVHKMAFTQAMMSNCVLDEAMAKDLLYRISGTDSDAAYEELLAQANEEMNFAGFQLKRLKNPVDDLQYLGFVNKEADLPSKMGTKLTVPQREFFKAVIECIARAEPGPIGVASQVELMNLEVAARGQDEAGTSTQAAAQKTLTKQDRVRTIHDLLSERWLADAPNMPNRYCLGVRTYMELSDFLLALDNLPEATRTLFEDKL